METVTLTIDGRPITVEKGKTVLQAAIENGISVPYYCYHPGIGIEGSCRVCIVKIEKMPKLQTSCSTVCTEGMVVDTRSPEVEAARANARAGGPTNARDRELLDKYGALSGTRGYSRSGLRRLGHDHRAHRHRPRD
mgnify:CR=1 FL=1